MADFDIHSFTLDLRVFDDESPFRIKYWRHFRPREMSYKGVFMSKRCESRQMTVVRTETRESKMGNANQSLIRNAKNMEMFTIKCL